LAWAIDAKSKPSRVHAYRSFLLRPDHPRQVPAEALNLGLIERAGLAVVDDHAPAQIGDSLALEADRSGHGADDHIAGLDDPGDARLESQPIAERCELRRRALDALGLKVVDGQVAPEVLGQDLRR
jgi:hypothetical protein